MDENNRQSGPRTDKENVPDKEADKVYAQQAQNGTTESGAQDAPGKDGDRAENNNAADPETEGNKDAAAQDKNSAPDLKYDNMKEVAKSGALGAFIGLAVIVPGVSGSAVAIIMKLYEKLLYAIGNIFRQFKSCAIFLLPIAAGAAAGLVLGFFGVKILLDIMLFAVVALFAGLMAGAFPAVWDELKGSRKTALRVGLFATGVIVPIAISLIAVFAGGGRQSLENPQAYEYIIYLVLGFAVALTQLVPGLSATALLMATGHYVPLVDSVSITYWQNNPEIFAVYACLIAGFVAGLLCFAKLMNLLLKKYRAATFFAVAGLALGSLITMFFNPEMFAEYVNWNKGQRFGPDLAFGSILFVIGFVAAYAFVRIQRKNAARFK